MFFSFIIQAWHGVFFNFHNNKTSSNQFQLCKCCCLLSNFSTIFPFSFFVTAEHSGENSFLCLLKGLMLDLEIDSQNFLWRSQDAERGSLSLGNFDSHQYPLQCWPKASPRSYAKTSRYTQSPDWINRSWDCFCKLSQGLNVLVTSYLWKHLSCFWQYKQWVDPAHLFVYNSIISVIWIQNHSCFQRL